MGLTEFIDEITPLIPAEAAGAGVDPQFVYDGMVTDFIVDSRDDAIDEAMAYSDGVETEYHEPAKRGIMRTSGIDEAGYYDALENDPALMFKLRSDYMASI